MFIDDPHKRYFPYALTIYWREWRRKTCLLSGCGSFHWPVCSAQLLKFRPSSLSRAWDSPPCSPALLVSCPASVKVVSYFQCFHWLFEGLIVIEMLRLYSDALEAQGPTQKFEELTTGQFMAINQYSDRLERGYMPPRTPWPRICLTVSISTGRGPSNSATPLHFTR